MADPDKPPLETVYPPAEWRRIAHERGERTQQEFLRDTGTLAGRRAGVRAELNQLALDLEDEVFDRLWRLKAMLNALTSWRTGRLSPTELLASGGYTVEDTGLPEGLGGWASVIPDSLEEARALLVWLRLHPSKLPSSPEPPPED